MGERRSSRSGLLLLLGLLPALAIGAFLAMRDASHAAPPPPPTVARIAAPLLPATSTPLPPPTATPLPATATLTATTIPTTPTPEPTAEPTPPPATPTVPPAPTWVEVGHWRSSEILYTAPFTVRGPWRIRWQLSSSAESCQVMIIDDSANPPLLTGAAGATSGVFSLQSGGTYSLMLHNTIPYEIVVEDFR